MQTTNPQIWTSNRPDLGMQDPSFPRLGSIMNTTRIAARVILVIGFGFLLGTLLVL